MPGPLDGVQIPPSKVRDTTRSRDRGYPGISKGPVLTRVRPYPMRLRSPLRRRPTAAAWLVARDISQRAEPDIRPLSRADSAFIAKRTRRLPTLLTGDVAPSAFNVSCPLRWQATLGPSCRQRTCPVHCQTVRLCRAAHCVHHPLYEKFPCTPRQRRSWMSGRKKIAPAANISSSKYYIRYVPGPTCRGLVPLYMPPLAIKGEACNVTSERGKKTKLR
jgi:hypothetical protein